MKYKLKCLLCNATCWADGDFDPGTKAIEVRNQTTGHSYEWPPENDTCPHSTYDVIDEEAISGYEMTATERQRRISDLESHFGIPSAEVIRQAEAGTLPAGTHYVEWLVLLDRGDLVRGSSWRR